MMVFIFSNFLASISSGMVLMKRVFKWDIITVKIRKYPIICFFVPYIMQFNAVIEVYLCLNST